MPCKEQFIQPPITKPYCRRDGLHCTECKKGGDKDETSVDRYNRTCLSIQEE